MPIVRVVLTVIFGAGASYDSIPAGDRPSDLLLSRAERKRRREYERNYRPPLGQQLFEDRPFFRSVIGDYRTIAILARRLGSLPTTVNLEGELDRLREEAQDDPVLRRELAGLRFYLRRVLWECTDRWANWAPGETNYHALLRRLRQWAETSDEEVALITFNYDLLLEHAIRDSIGGVRLTDMAAYISHGKYKILRPHGAVNWARNFGRDVPRGWSKQEIEQAMIDFAGDNRQLELGDYELVDKPTVVARGARALFPALTLPVQSKSFEMPTEHERELERALALPTRILVIGWRASEQSFLELWKRVRQTRPLLLVVGADADSGARTMERISEYAVPEEGLASVSPGFSGFVLARELDDFLAL